MPSSRSMLGQLKTSKTKSKPRAQSKNRRTSQVKNKQN